MISSWNLIENFYDQVNSIHVPQAIPLGAEVSIFKFHCLSFYCSKQLYCLIIYTEKLNLFKFSRREILSLETHTRHCLNIRRFVPCGILRPVKNQLKIVKNNF